MIHEVVMCYWQSESARDIRLSSAICDLYVYGHQNLYPLSQFGDVRPVVFETGSTKFCKSH